MRILQVSTLRGHTRAEQVMLRSIALVGAALSRRGHEVTLFVVGAAPRTEAAGIEVVHLGKNPRASLLALSAHPARPALTHVFGHRSLLSGLVARATRKAGGRLLLSPGEDLPATGAPHRRWTEGLSLRVLGMADAVLVRSEVERRQFAHAGVPRERLHLVPQALELLSPDEAGGLRPQRIKAQLGLAPTDRVIVCPVVSSDAPELRLVAATLPHLSMHAKLVVCGRGDSLVRELSSQLAANPSAQVVELGHDSELHELMAAADVWVDLGDLASGVDPSEALAIGTPVVVAEGSSAAEQLATLGGVRTTTVDHPWEAARTIDAILRDQPRWRADARKAAPTLRARHSVSAVAARLEELYT